MKRIGIIFATVVMMMLFAFSASALEETGQCGDNIYWSFNESSGELVISGNGDMWDSSLFRGSDGIISVVIEEGVTSIVDYAFFGSASLKYVKIPASVTSIGKGAFAYCLLLKEIIVDETNKYYSNDEHGVLFNKDKTTLLQYPVDLEDMLSESPETPEEKYELYLNLLDDFIEYKVPDTVTTIGDYAFYYARCLTGIILPDSLMNIGEKAFYCSEWLFYLKIPGSITNKNLEYLPVVCLELAEGIKAINADGGVWLENDFVTLMIPSTVTKIDSEFFVDSDIEHIFYAGTEEEWNQMVSVSDRESLKDTEVHFNCCKGTHEFTTEIAEPVYYGDILMSTDIHTCEKCGWYYGVCKWDLVDHRMTEWEELAHATCTKEGEERRSCEGCEYCGYYETRTTPKKDHAYSSSITRPATHLTTGIRTYTCTACGDTYTGEIPTTKEHIYTVSNIVAPTCEEEGYTVYVCECGYVYNGDNVAPTGHNYNGDTCVDCGESKTDNCTCNCHKGGFMGFIWKILRFFYKLFGTNKTCSCGVAHY